LTAARRMLPVEMAGMPSFAVRISAWVPLPAPGAPNRIRFISMLLSCQLTYHIHKGTEKSRVPLFSSAFDDGVLFCLGKIPVRKSSAQETLVVAHGHIAVQAAGGIQCDADNDQHTGA